MLNGDQPIRKVEANLEVASSSKGKGNQTMINKSKISRPPKVERKRTMKPKVISKSKYFFYSKKWYFKANCKEWKDYLTTKGEGMKFFILEVCLVEDLIDYWVIDLGATNHVCMFLYKGLRRQKILDIKVYHRGPEMG